VTTDSTYAAAKGRPAPARGTAAPSPAKARQTPLTATDMASVEANKAFVLEHLPEALPFIRALHAEGLIDGWRCVMRCTLLDAGRHE